jgi:hypothetical protein
MRRAASAVFCLDGMNLSNKSCRGDFFSVGKALTLGGQNRAHLEMRRVLNEPAPVDIKADHFLGQCVGTATK